MISLKLIVFLLFIVTLSAPSATVVGALGNNSAGTQSGAPSGYPNPGNTCHLNSLLQSLRTFVCDTNSDNTSDPLTTSLTTTRRAEALDSNLELLNLLNIDWRVQYDVPEGKQDDSTVTIHHYCDSLQQYYSLTTL